MARPGLHRDSPSMRSVGYRQFWAHLAGETSLEVAMERALFATRQLAKRQLTWLRSENDAVFSLIHLKLAAIALESRLYQRIWRENCAEMQRVKQCACDRLFARFGRIPQ